MTDKLFDPESIGTLGGASFAIVVINAVARRMLKIDTPWLAFVLSLVIAFAGAQRSGHLRDLLDYLIAALNGCLIFFTALGLNETAEHTLNKPPPGTVKPHAARPKMWLQSWFVR